MARAPDTSLAPNIIAAGADGGRIAENIVRFARTLRRTGLSIGPERTVMATRAVLAAGISSLPVFHAALRTSLVTRPEHYELFDEAFRLFWKEPSSLAQPDATSGIEDHATDDMREISRRLLEALDRPSPPHHPTQPDEIEFDARETFSHEEILREKDFEQMSAAELREARRAIADIPLIFEAIATRRFRPAADGSRIDIRKILRQMAGKGPDYVTFARMQRTRRHVPIVVLVDISGSMDTYARMMLHFLYALIGARTRVHAFLFGTRLTNVTRLLANRDPDDAIDRVATLVADWAGGTRIGESIATFNRHWARRVLGQNATVLLVTDGLDREGGESLDRAARRLRASCRRLVWLNPLLRYDGYEPLARGAGVLNRYASTRLACHNVRSLEELAAALSGGRRPLISVQQRGSRK